MERSFLNAHSAIHASFRIFDLRTRLRSAEGRAVGETWFDLIVHVLRAGVALHLTIADFDPVARSALHRGTWRSLRMLHAAAEVAGPRARLVARAAMHPARSGLLVRIAYWGAAQRRLGRVCAWLNDLPPATRAAALRDMPGIRARLTAGPDGSWRPRRGHLPCLYPATHHQKLAVFDDRRLYIGGMDLDERRYDTPEHDRPAAQTWHDVQVMMEGPVVAEARHHLDSFLAVTEGRVAPGPQRRLLRTLSRRRRIPLWHYGPVTVANELRQAHEALSDRTTNLIYAETQFFRDLRLARHLAGRARTNPDLTMILVLPAAPEDVAFENRSTLDARFGEFLQARALRILRAGFGARLFIGGVAQTRSAPRAEPLDRDRMNGAPVIYIHAKVSIFDDDAAIVSSANLNGRSLTWDSEAGVYLNGRRDVGELRRRVMGHWLPRDAPAEFFALDSAVRAWTDLAHSNLHRAPAERRGFILPYDLTRAERFGRHAPGVPDEMV
nr:phospholipase D-like domain-containing protein [Falsirhodobacter halotolerans]